MTEAQYLELEERMRRAGAVSAGSAEMVTAPPYVRPKAPKAEKVQPIEGPLSILLTLYGHCPSKKSNYRVAASGTLISTAETKAQVEALTLQAMFQWAAKCAGPVEHPEVTTRFYVAAKRQDEDGMYVTLMDVLQMAGVIVNDNIAHFNGRKIHEPCEVVPEAEERVEIRLEKKDGGIRPGIQIS